MDRYDAWRCHGSTFLFRPAGIQWQVRLLRNACVYLRMGGKVSARARSYEAGSPLKCGLLTARPISLPALCIPGPKAVMEASRSSECEDRQSSDGPNEASGGRGQQCGKAPSSVAPLLEGVRREVVWMLPRSNAAMRTAAMHALAHVHLEDGVLDRGDGQVQRPLIPMAQLINVSDYRLALSLCEVCRSSEYIVLEHVLMNVFAMHGSTLEFLAAVSADEIQRCTTADMLFRSNTARVHLLSSYVRKHAFCYLQKLIGPLVARLAVTDDHVLELEPARIQGGRTVEENREEVQLLVLWLLERLDRSAEAVPRDLRRLCGCIKAQVAQRFPTAQHRAMGDLLLLRLFGPSIVNPRSVGLSLPEHRATLRRDLLLVSKVMLALGHNGFPPHKEPYLTALNPFLEQCRGVIIDFVERVCSVDATSAPDAAAVPENTYPDESLPLEDRRMLHTLFSDYAERIAAELREHGAADPPLFAGNPLPVPQAVRQDARLRPWLQAVGEAQRRVRPGGADATATHEAHLHINSADALGPLRLHPPVAAERVADALLRGQWRHDSSALYACAYVGPVSRAGRPVLYLLPALLPPAHGCDWELLVCHVLSLLNSALADRAYDVVLDCTGAEAPCMVPPAYIAFFLSAVTPAALQLLHTVFVLNLSSAVRLQLRQWGIAREQDPFCTHFPSWCSAVPSAALLLGTRRAELERWIAPEHLRLPPHTMHVLSSAPLYQLSQLTLSVGPCAGVRATLCLLSEYAVIYSLDAVPCFGGFEAHTCDALPLATLHVEVAALDGAELLVCRSGNGQPLRLHAERPGELAQLLHEAQARTSAGHATATPAAAPPARGAPRPLGGALCHAACDDEQLRTTAQHLLGALDVCAAPYGPAPCTTVAPEAARRIATPDDALNVLEASIHLSACLGEKRPQVELSYLVPLLPRIASLARSPRGAQYTRLCSTLADALRLATWHVPLRPTLRRALWEPVRDVPALAETMVEACLVAVPTGELRALGGVKDAVACIASHQLHGKLLVRLRHAPSADAGRQAVLMHLLAVVCCAPRAQVQQLLPETLHAVLSFARSASPSVNAAVYAVQCSLLHALAASSDGVLDRDARLAVAEQWASEAGAKLCGMSSPGSAEAQAASHVNSSDRSLLAAHAALALTILEAGAPSTAVAAQWRARLLGLALHSALSAGHAVRARNLQLVSALITGELEEEDLVLQLLVRLLGELQDCSARSVDAVAVAMLECVAELLPHLSPWSCHLPRLFWVGMALAQRRQAPLVQAALELALAALTAVARHWPVLRKQAPDSASGLVDFLAMACSSRLSALVAPSLTDSFALGIASALCPLLFNDQHRESASLLLRSLLGYASSPVTSATGQGDCAELDRASQLGIFLLLYLHDPSAEALRELLVLSRASEALQQTWMRAHEGPAGLPLPTCSADAMQAATQCALVFPLATNEMHAAFLCRILKGLVGKYPRAVQRAREPVLMGLRKLVRVANEPTPNIHGSDVPISCTPAEPSRTVSGDPGLDTPSSPPATPRVQLLHTLEWLEALDPGTIETDAHQALDAGGQALDSSWISAPPDDPAVATAPFRSRQKEILDACLTLVTTS